MASAAAAVILKLAQRLREEFEESPGLCVTIDEGTPFWGLDEDVCEVVLSELVVYEPRSRRNYKDTLHGRVRPSAPG